MVYFFDTSIQLRRANPKVKGHVGKVAVTRGPLVYCIKNVDNPDVDIYTARLDPSSLHDEFIPDLLGGCFVIHGKATDGKLLKSLFPMGKSRRVTDDCVGEFEIIVVK